MELSPDLMNADLRLICDSQAVEVARLQAALAPFAALGRRLPDWPEYCPLRIDSGPDRNGRKYEWVAYHGVGDDGEPLDCDHPLLPTIGDWKRAVEAAGE